MLDLDELERKMGEVERLQWSNFYEVADYPEGRQLLSLIYNNFSKLIAAARERNGLPQNVVD